MLSSRNGLSKPTVELMTENVGIREIPAGGTEGPPGPQHLDLHLPRTRCAAVHQPEPCVLWGQRRRREGGLVLLYPQELGERPEGQHAFLLLLNYFHAADNAIIPPVPTPSLAHSLLCSPTPGTAPVSLSPYVCR